MDTKLILLALYLQELGVSENIDNKANRLKLQKAVYLGQAAGVNLGYRYSWYLNGPYSTDLTRDYYKLAEHLQAGEQIAPYVLRDDFKASLEPVRQLMNLPASFTPTPDIGNPQASWLELLASLDYSRRILRMSEAASAEYVSKEKPRLANYVHAGLETLRNSPLRIVGY